MPKSENSGWTQIYLTCEAWLREKTWHFDHVSAVWLNFGCASATRIWCNGCSPKTPQTSTTNVSRRNGATEKLSYCPHPKAKSSSQLKKERKAGVRWEPMSSGGLGGRRVKFRLFLSPRSMRTFGFRVVDKHRCIKNSIKCIQHTA